MLNSIDGSSNLTLTGEQKDILAGDPAFWACIRASLDNRYNEFKRKDSKLVKDKRVSLIAAEAMVHSVDMKRGTLDLEIDELLYVLSFFLII
jgi:hypothetical protein